jgi:uncharacterized protein YgiM (DUF1202 family)
MAAVGGHRTPGALRRAGLFAGWGPHGALLLLVLLFELSWVALPLLARARVPSQAAETIIETRLRTEPSLRSDPLLRLPAGTTVIIHGTPEDGWYRAQHGQLEGYVRSGDVATAPLSVSDAAQPGQTIDEPLVVEQAQRARRGRGKQGKHERARHGEGKDDRKQRRKRERKQVRANARDDAGRVITATDLNLRGAPSGDAPVQTTMPRGSRVVLTGVQQDGWVEVQWEDATGWALGRHLAVGRRQAAESDGDPTTWSRAELKAIIFEAADRYGQPREDMLRVARCESNMEPSAVNRHGGSYGLFQFKPGTWLSTPFAEYDIFDPRASANAAAWMWSVGRRREWVCQ